MNYVITTSLRSSQLCQVYEFFFVCLRISEKFRVNIYFNLFLNYFPQSTINLKYLILGAIKNKYIQFCDLFALLNIPKVIFELS
jgi:hypothetical protein